MERLERLVERWGVARRLPLDGMGGWLLVAAIVPYVLWGTSGWLLQTGLLPYWPLWLIAVAVALALAAAAVPASRGRRLRPVEALAVVALVTMVLTDLTMVTQPLRDLGIYLKAGEHYLADTPVYMRSVLTAAPADRSNYPFLYPPFTLPLFGALSLLPVPLVQALWVVAAVGLAMWSLRVMGVPLRWALAAVVWPPLFEGLWVGNVAVPALALFALAPWFGTGLVLGAVFKSYDLVAALWLVRRRAWAALIAGVAFVAAAAVVTLPLVGVERWLDWLDALQLYRASQPLVVNLYGMAIARYAPFAVYVVLAVLAVVAAWRARGRESLARFGTATIVASPSLYGHGFLVAVPALLSLRTTWLWLAIATMSVPDGVQWWGAVGIVALSWALPELRRSTLPAGARREPLHPLGQGVEAWPGAPTEPQVLGWLPPIEDRDAVE